MSAQSDLALIVCTYRRPQALARLLDAVARQTRRPDEVLVVDGSPDAASEHAIAHHLAPPAHSRYLRVAPEARGLTRQRNLGIVHTQARLVAFLDDDTVPEVDYFAQILAAFEQHPDAVGIGGYLTGTAWQRGAEPAGDSHAHYRHGAWTRAEALRWRLRRRLGLDSPLPPGWMPPSGHARSLGYLPPDGRVYRVEFLMGGAATWRRSLLEKRAFSHLFDGYGLYEDLDFSLRTRGLGALYLCTRARLAHLHEPVGRPRPLRYGRMVTRNGWRVWRTRWPKPALGDRCRWWMTTLLLAACRLGGGIRGPHRLQALAETAGRLAGAAEVLVQPPSREVDPDA